MKKIIASCILSAAIIGVHGMASAADPIKSQYKADVASADADYKTGKEKCKPMKGNDKDVCQKEAKATHETAIAKAKENRKMKDAHKDMAETKNDQQYKVAKEKCDAMSGAEKDKCVTAAKVDHAK